MVQEHDFVNFPELSNKQLETLEFASPHKQITENFFATVVKVHDGDTITLRVDFRDFDFPLRLLDIDAPELNEGGSEAAEWLKDRLEGEEIEVLIDNNNRVGKFGRLLGRVFYRGMDTGQEMLVLGLVVPFGLKGESEFPNINKLLAVQQWF